MQIKILFLLLLGKGGDRSSPSHSLLLNLSSPSNPAQIPYPLREFSGSLSGNASLSLPIFPLPFVCSLIIALIYQSLYPLPLPERIKDGFQKCMQQDILDCPRGFVTPHRHASVGILGLGVSVSPPLGCSLCSVLSRGIHVSTNRCWLV